MKNSVKPTRTKKYHEAALAEVVRLWKEPEEGAMPWAIHPKIIERLKSRERTTVT